MLFFLLHARLGGEAELHVVLVGDIGRAHLHPSGQYRVRGRKHGNDQDGTGPGQPWQGVGNGFFWR